MEELVPAEADLVAAAMSNQSWSPPNAEDILPVNPRHDDWGADRTIRGEVLYQLLTGGRPDWAGRDWSHPPPAVRIRGARIVGLLELEAARLRCLLHMVGCWLDLDETPVLRDASATVIRIQSCWVPRGLDARQLTTTGECSLQHCQFDNQVRLLEAHIGRQLDLTGSKFSSNGADSALVAERVQVDRDVFFGQGFIADGEVSLFRSYVGGQLDFTGAKFRNAGQVALSADRMDVGRDLFCGEGFEAVGEVNFAGSHVGGQVDLTNGRFQLTEPRNDEARGERVALRADRLQVDHDVFCGNGFKASGGVIFAGSHIGGRVDLTAGKFHNPGGVALNADRLNVEHDVFCGKGFTAEGEVRFAGGHIGGQFTVTSGHFRNPSGVALDADRLKIGHDLFCEDGFIAYGEVRLFGAHVGGQALFVGSRFCNAGMDALNAEWLSVGKKLSWQPAQVSGKASFEFSQVGMWSDAPKALEIPLCLHYLRYSGLDSSKSDLRPDDRISWLDRDPAGYSPQPFNQLAAAYRSVGQSSAARRVLVQSELRRYLQPARPGRFRTVRSWIAWLWSQVLYFTVGFGYFPWRALILLTVLVIVGGLTVRLLPDDKFKRGEGAPEFNSLLYTLDELLPFVDLGFNRWAPNGSAQIITVILVILGWMLVTVVISAFSNILRRGD